DTELIQVEVASPQEAGLELGFRAAVDVENHRPGPGELRRRPVEKAADFAAVEALPVDRLRLGESAGIETTRLALRPSLQLTGRHIERIGVGGGPGGTKGKAE